MSKSKGGSGGGRANDAGRKAELVLLSHVEHFGYQSVPPRFFLPMSEALEQPLYSTQCEIGESIYKKAWRCDLIIFHPKRYKNCFVIESKWQKSSGSVDEKYPYLVLSIEEGDFDSLIVLDGGGCSKEAMSWLKNQANKNKRLKYVLSAKEFEQWSWDNI